MRNLLTSAIAAFAFATVVAGSASAAETAQHVNNLALQDQLERDATDHALRQAGAGQVISRAHQAAVLSTRAQDKG